MTQQCGDAITDALISKSRPSLMSQPSKVWAYFVEEIFFYRSRVADPRAPARFLLRHTLAASILRKGPPEPRRSLVLPTGSMAQHAGTGNDHSRMGRLVEQQRIAPAVRHLDEALKESRDDLRLPQTHSWSRTATMTRPIRRKRQIPARHHRAMPDRKGARARFTNLLCALAKPCFSEESAQMRNSQTIARHDCLSHHKKGRPISRSALKLSRKPGLSRVLR